MRVLAIALAFEACATPASVLYDSQSSDGDGFGLHTGSNGTVAFSLRREAGTRAVVAGDPGLQILYTRIGCGGDDPDSWFGVGGTLPIELPAGDVVAVREVQVTADSWRESGLNDPTRVFACVSYRKDGAWHAGTYATAEPPLGQIRATVTLRIDASADALAIGSDSDQTIQTIAVSAVD